MSKGKTLKPETREFAKSVIVLTTFPASECPPDQGLQWYRIRWPVERVFKRFTSIAQRGHLPKSNPDRAKAWLCGKLFTALFTERLIPHAVAISPWGYELRQMSHPAPVERIPIPVPSGLSRHLPAHPHDRWAGRWVIDRDGTR
ncbi:MAG: transposase [Rhodobacteraceae bacterium]|nr:transposase [Paracoccaceae bacterium]MCY4326454.1 transposase [Paracoccaceae bacterium]